MDEFNYLQFLNDDNDLLADEQLLADDFPTFDVSFSQMVADFSLNVAAVPNCLESTGIKTKTATTTTQQDEAADVSRFPVVSNEDIEKLKAGLNLKFDQNVDIFLFLKSYASGTEECYGKCFRVNFALFRCWRIVLFSAVEEQFRLPW